MKTLVLEQTSRKLWLRLLAWLTVIFLYQETRAQIANAPCNGKKALTQAAFTSITVAKSTPFCLGGSSITNEGRVVDADTTNSATVSIGGVLCSASISVEDGNDTYPAGTFAGFEIGTAGLIGASIGAKVTIHALNNGVEVQSYDAVTSLIGLNSSLLTSSGHAIVGFIPNVAFDGIRIEYSALLGTFSANVYNAIIEKFCAGSSLVCNTQTQINSPGFPTVIDGNETGITGVACVGCSVTDADNVLTSSTTDYATITMAVSLGTTASLAVKDQLTDYTAGTFAGFNISNANLIGANLLSGITIKTYLNGVLKETSGSGTLLSLSSALLTGTGEQLVGFVTTQAFDEVKIEIQNLLGIGSTTRVYNAVFMKLCAGPALTCTANTSIVMPTYPATINGSHTGISGAVCALCAVNNPLNVIDNSTTNYGEIVLTAGLISSGSIAIKDGVTTYPAGTFAGFDIENSSLIGVNLFGGAAIVTTYLNGVQKETSTGKLISLQLLSSSRQVVGFTTTLPFDEVRITVANLVSLDIGTTKVYGLVLRGGSAAGALPPAITPTTAANTCPTTTVNLRTLANTGSVPSGAKLVWSTSKTPSSSSDTISNASAVSLGGKYYALYQDTSTGCFGLYADSVTVSVTNCSATGSAPGCVATSNIKVWLRADIGIASVDGAAVTSWTDQSASGYNVAQPTAIYQPKYYSTTTAKLINFNPTLDFDGVDDHIRNLNPLMSSTSPYTFLGVNIDEAADLGYRSFFSSEEFVDFFSLYKELGAPLYNGWTPYAIGGLLSDRGTFGKGTKYSVAGGVNGYWNGTNFTSDASVQVAQPTIVGMSGDNVLGTSSRANFFTYVDGWKDSPGNWSPTDDNIALTQSRLFKAFAVGADMGNNGVPAETWKGRIPEIIAYDRQLTDAEMAKVNTYFAIKYGITLGQGNGSVGVNGNNYNYVSGDGTVIWDATANSTYKHTIAGIGQDNCQGLFQKQSKSVQSDEILTISGGTVVAATNLANDATSTTIPDKAFLVWGSNGLSTSFGVPYTPNSYTPTGSYFRMNRVWKVQETGTVGAVILAVPQGKHLLVSNDPTFATGVTEVATTTDGNGNQTASFNFTTGQYFTFGNEAFAPGCVAGGNIRIWLKADAGISAADGAAVTSWADQSLFTYDVTQPTANYQPKYYKTTASKLINFNPTLDFDGVDDHIRNLNPLMSSTSPYTFLGVNIDEAADLGYRSFFSSEEFVDFFSLYKELGAPLYNGWTPYAIGGLLSDRGTFGKGTKYSVAGGVNGYWNGTNFTSDASVQVARPTIVGMSGDNVLGTTSRANFFTYVDGWKDSPGNWSPTDDNIALTQSRLFKAFAVGADMGSNGVPAETWKGRIPEIIAYDRQLTDAEMAKVNTYFAIKYGITLGQGNGSVGVNGNNYNYVSGDGAVIWDATANSTYKYDIFGIGRDDCQALNQKQSTSIQDNILMIGNGTGIGATNAANANNLSADKSFEVIGSNGLSKSYDNTYAPNSYTPTTGFFRMSRIWKVQETGTVGTVTVSIPGSGNGVYLLVKNTNDFSTSSGVTETHMTPDGNGNLTAQVNFTNGQYFTFGSELTAPGCVTGGLAVWLKADNGTGTTIDGADVTAWQDASGNGRTHVAATGTTLSLGKPSYVVNSGFNFNPALNFSSAGQGDGLVTSAFASGNEAVHVFAVTKVDDNGWRAIYSFRRDGTHPQWLSSVPSVWLGANYSTTTNNGVLYGVTSHILNKTTADNQQMWWNGSKYTFTGNKGYLYSDNLSGNSRMYVGNDAFYDGINFTGSEVFGGDIMEVAIYKTGTPTTLGGPMADVDIKKIQSYLGLKYGITLAHEYYSGGGVKVWDNADATFHRNVAGIARDDCQALNQKQARSYTSADMTVAIDDSIATTNAANPGSFSNDKAFLMFGDNNGTGVATLTSNPCNPPIVDKFTNKTWKFVETGSVEAAKVSVDLSSAGFNASYPVFMQVASDASFSTIVASVPMVKNGSKYETSYDFNGTRYVRFLGNTTPPANVCSDDKIYRWNQPFWTWGTTNRTTTFADGQNINVRIQGNGIYLPTIHPYSLGWWEHIFIPRYDKLSDNNKIITRIGMAKVASKVSFEVFDLDEYYGKDVVEVYGKLGSTVVSPKITFPQYTALTKTGNVVSATTGVWDISQRGRFYVNFESPVDSVIIQYSRGASPFSYNFNTYQDIRIENLEIQCIPPAPKAPTADNVYVFKEVTTANPKVGEEFTYKFTIQNLAACDSVRTINFTDVLPSGLTWVDSTLATGLTLTGLNAYGGGQTLTFSSTVPGGVSYLYVKAKGSNTGTLNNQATFTVNRTSGVSPVYKSDDPRQSGSQDATPVTINANKPTANLQLTKSANKTTAGANEDIVYTHTIKNNGGASVTMDFQDNLPGNAGGGLTYTGVYTTVPGAPASIATSPLAGSSSILIRGITVPAGGTVSFTLTANTGTFTGGNTATNIATVTPDSNYRQTTVSSNGVNVQIGSCAAGSTAPALSANTKSNVCPAITANLTTITASNTPAGTGIKLTWHTATPATSANRVTNPAAVPAGTYYAAFADTVSNCFAGAGSATTLVTVTTTLCTSTPPAQTASAGASQSGNAATELNPQGGTTPYTYTDDTNNCTAPGGATKLPVGSNLTVNPTSGAYTYTAPNTAGTYYFCIKVCDNSTPTAKCTTVTYTVTVGASAGAGTIDCAKTVIYPAPVAGTPSQHSLIVTVNVTTAGCFTPLTVTGSGMSVASGITQVCASTTGVQTLHIPIRYDGTSLGTMNFTIGTLTSCSADLSTVSAKKVIADVWTLDNCSAVQVGPQLK